MDWLVAWVGLTVTAIGVCGLALATYRLGLERGMIRAAEGGPAWDFAEEANDEDGNEGGG